VSEDEFVNGTRYFSNFRNSRNERVHLRVYSLDLERPDASVRIRVQADLPAGWTFIHDDEYKLDVKQRYTSLLGPDNLVEQRPLALEVLLDPILRDVPDNADIAVSVKPVNDLNVWAILSETNIGTNRVRASLPE
jgi:hypothetical protein